MSHHPLECEHVWSSWSTVESVNAAGEQMFVFQRHCFQCPCVEEQAGAIVEPSEMRYTKILEAGSEPDD